VSWEPIEWVDGHKTTECPVLWYPEFEVVFRGYEWLKLNKFPHGGGWADQPAVLMQLMEHVAAEVRNG